MMIQQKVMAIYGYRELLLALTYRDIRVKYKQAAMGIAWAFLMPVLAISSGIMFRLAMALFSGKSPQVTDMVAVMVKSVPWLLFAAIIGSSSNSLVGNMGLITKIYFPREVVPLSGLLSSLFDFSISVVGLIMVLTLVTVFSPGSEGSPVVFSMALLWVPVLLGVLIVMATGLGLFFSCANLFLRDVKYIVQVLLQFGIMFSLVYFTYAELGRWGWVLLLNPVAPLLEGLRTSVIDGRIDPYLWPWLGYSASLAVVVFIGAIQVFERAESLFAEYA